MRPSYPLTYLDYLWLSEDNFAGRRRIVIDIKFKRETKQMLITTRMLIGRADMLPVLTG